MKELQKIEIHWRDSHRYMYQMERNEPVEVAIMKTVGWLVRETENEIVIAQDILGEDMRGVEVICAENVLERHKLISK